MWPMTTQIHPYLLARLIAVQEAFNHPGFRPAMAGNFNNPVAAAPKQGNKWNEIIKEEDKGDESGGGGGTMKGNRGKNAVNAAAAMKKLSRNR